MERIYTVRLIRENKQAIQGIYLKEFWKLCGVYVREYVTDNDLLQQKELEQEVDCNIYFGKIMQTKWQNRAKAKYDFLLNLGNAKIFNTTTRRGNLGDCLQNLLVNMGEELSWDEELKHEFQKILDMFIECDYAYNEYKFHLFVSQMKNSRDGLLGVYKNCLNQLLDDGRLMEGQYIRFAYINCARKYERICTEDEKIGYFEKRDLMCEAHKLTERDDKFTSGDMLAGMIGLSYRPLWDEGEAYLKNAIEKEKEQKHCAFMYYALGHFYEWQRGNLEKAWKEYEKIEKVDDQNYRMIYKMACREVRNGELEEAIKTFKSIYEKMKRLSDSKWISPIELEYYYKCANFLSVHGRVSADEVREIREKEFERSECISNFFAKSDMKICKEMLLETMENRGKYCR